MIFVQLLFLLCVSVVLITLVEGQGRRPQTIEHNYCNLMFAEELDNAKKIDRRAITQAYRLGQNGSLCMTNCRLVSRGNVKPMEALQSPDFIQCAPGPQYCYKGNCSSEKDLAQLLRKNRTSNP